MAKLRESKSARRERAQQIIMTLEQAYPESRIALDFHTPFQLLVALILAAQNTDARVNMVTPELFERYPTPQAFIDVPQEELEKAVFTCGFYRNKSKAIKAASQTIVERFGGEVPGTMDELLTLPGIGRKSANVLLGHCFNTPGIVVDTHVRRITNLLGIVDSDDPDKIELQLSELIPENKWTISGHLFQSHGREVCIARRPKCSICPVAMLCASAGIGEPPPPGVPDRAGHLRKRTAKK